MTASPTVQTLREFLDAKRAQGRRTPLTQSVQMIVPLCVEIADLHVQGFRLLLHPSNIKIESGRLRLDRDRATSAPQTAADQACLAPELNQQPAGAQASVYSIGAILYELYTGLSAGPGMARPRDVVATAPPALEAVLSKALVADATHRPDDLYALAQAVYHLAPQPTIPPPPAADESRLDHVGDVNVDVSLSMLPPRPGATPVGVPQGLNLRTRDPAPQPKGDAATLELSELKKRLESDPTPRYVVIRDGMDHGPFTAVELLQQVASHKFTGEDLLADQVTGDEQPISEWEDFAPFADHARRHRDIADERAAVDRSVARESRQTKGKALIAASLFGVLLVGAGAWFVTQKGVREDSVEVQTETVTSVDSEGSLKSKKKRWKGGKKTTRRVVGSQGGIPILSGGLSCAAARAAYVEEITMTGGSADITSGQYASIMNSGGYFSHCGVPSNVAVHICAAVQAGRAKGVTVTTKPRHASGRCVSQAVRRLKFPSHAKLDVVRTSFAAQ